MKTAAVIVATYRRPDYLRTCLEHLERQTVKPDRIIVVDASPDTESKQIAAGFPHVEYRRNDLGPGTLAASRAIGVQGVDDDVIAFIDDDAFAEPQWLGELLAAYRDPDVGAVGGRARNGQPDEELEGIDRIGRFLRDGRLTGYFAADPGRCVEVDHMLGANMSVRADVLREIRGIHDYYPGTCLREDADLALRVKLAGYRILFAPDAVVRHVGGTYAKGRRFDLRYRAYGCRNHILLLTTTVGWTNPRFVRYLGRAGIDVVREALSGFSVFGDPARVGVRATVRAVGGGFVRAVVDLAGTVWGLAAAVRPVDRAVAFRPERVTR